MSGDRSFVKNAADRDQVGRAARKEADNERIFLASLKAVQSTQEGRFVMRTLLERAGIFRSIWENSARIHYNAGRQDMGHEIQAMLVATDENAYELMEREARARDLKLRKDLAATPRATEGA